MTRLFVRTTSDGVVIRGYVMHFDQSVSDLKIKLRPQQLVPAAGVRVAGLVQREVSNDFAVTQTGASSQPMHAPAELRGQLYLGEAEQAPVAGWMVQTDDTVTNVRATWPDGFVDEMAPAQGWVMVAHNGTLDVPSTVVATAADGSTTALTQVASYPSECTPPPPPPPALPSPGSEQPDDVQAATDGVHPGCTRPCSRTDSNRPAMERTSKTVRIWRRLARR